MKTIKKFNSIESFETDRLIAKQLTPHDLDKFILMHNNHQVMSTLGGLRSDAKSKENLEWNLNQWADNGFGLWMFYLKENNEWVGRGGLRRIRIGDQEEIELAYALMPTFWKLGLATEIAQACIEIAFEVLRFNTIVCYTLRTNKLSQRVMEKVGFNYERDLMVTFEGADYPHVLYRMKNYRTAEVVPYHPQWAHLFELEAQEIKAALGSALREIHHIGSTAIPNMIAKPIIDILIECEDVSDIETIKNNLYPLGYLYLSRQVIPHRSFFTRKVLDTISYHIHIYERGDPQVKRHVDFRDYLITHPEDAKKYAQLKEMLSVKYREDISRYVIGKDALIKEINHKAKVWPGRRKNFLLPNKGHSAKKWSDEKIRTCIAANFSFHLTYFAQYLKPVEMIRIPEYTTIDSTLNDEALNNVLDTDFSIANADKYIHYITDYFVGKNLPFCWWLSPYDKPKNLARTLEKNNYHGIENLIAMAVDLDQWQPEIKSQTAFKFVVAQDNKVLQDFASLNESKQSLDATYLSWIAEILTEEDPIEFVVGYLNDKAMVGGISCYYASVVGLYGLIRRSSQDQEYMNALQVFQLQQAKALGYHIAACYVKEDAVEIYRKLGFKEYGHYRKFGLK